MRVLFYAVQVLDGFPNTGDNVMGRHTPKRRPLIEVNRLAAAGGTMNFMNAGKAHTGVYWQDCEHGDHCDCLLLARAVGTGPEAVDVNYCREVLQKRWRMACNHGVRAPGPKRTRELPPHDSADPLQAILVANA